MTLEEVNDIIIVGTFMGITDLSPYLHRDGDYIGVYRGDLDYTEGLDWYYPNSNWNDLMSVYQKILTIEGDKSEITKYLLSGDVKLTYLACLDFIKKL
jgi:hypothetical protein